MNDDGDDDNHPASTSPQPIRSEVTTGQGTNTASELETKKEHEMQHKSTKTAAAAAAAPTSGDIVISSDDAATVPPLSTSLSSTHQREESVCFETLFVKNPAVTAAEDTLSVQSEPISSNNNNNNHRRTTSTDAQQQQQQLLQHGYASDAGFFSPGLESVILDEDGGTITRPTTASPTDEGEGSVVVLNNNNINNNNQSLLLGQETFEPLKDEPASSSSLSKKKKSRPVIKRTTSSVAPSIPAANINNNNNTNNADRIRLGICAMDKKARSKPMAEILSRLDENHFYVVFFGDHMILHEPVEEWPCCDVLIAFYSKGYPLDKAKQYVELHHPFILNDLDMQHILKDRRKVYDLLEASGIDVPRHVYLSRDGYVSTGTGAGNGNNDREVAEYDDHIEINGVVIHKPFVEKPVDAEDHNIAIYYPTSAGGGCKKLFRKVGNRSSEFYPDINEVRRDASYIYETFVETQGTDVKMYTVGPEYGHAEARKSPTVDGKVERDSDGKEIRFPVILTLREKEIARRIVLGFKQMVCGFDLLRVQEGDSLVPYVCDVNGWSFVKNSRKYYDDCAQILAEHILAAIKPGSFQCFSTVDPLVTDNLNDDDESVASKKHNRTHSTFERVTRMLQGDPIHHDDEEELISVASAPESQPTTLVEGAIPVRDMPDELASEPASMCPSSNSSLYDESETRTRKLSLPGSHKEELRCVIAVIRHGDRTPKQKLKVIMSEPHILDYFHRHTDNCRKDLKVKAKTPMKEFLATVKTMISEKEAGASHGDESVDREMIYKLKHMRDILERWKIAGLNRKLQIKPREWDEENAAQDGGENKVRCTKVQLILKWGGNLTKLGEKQAINLGQRLRHEMYPDAPGGGILRLHSTFRHDLKIKTSDEGRVMKTAAAFAKGLLELEGEIPPILVSLVHKEKDSMHMLDPSGNKEVKKELDECKEKINTNLQRDVDFSETSIEEHERLVGPSSLTSLHKALEKVNNPRKTLFQIHRTIGDLIDQLEEMLGAMASGDEMRNDGGEIDEAVYQALSGVKLYKGETLLELTERWRFLYKRLYDEDNDHFDLSRIPDVHDNVRFDMLHNPHLGLTGTLEKLYELAKAMADCVVPQEYGTMVSEKRSIGSKMCGALLEKIKYDLIIAREDKRSDMRYMIDMAYSADLPINTMGRRIRTRLYFTSESHLHTLLNVLRFGGSDRQKRLLSEKGQKIVNEAPELCYLTQVILRLFEDTRRSLSDPKRFRVEILFSPGATATPMHMAEMDRDSDSSRFDTSPLEMIGREGLTCQDVEEYFSSAIEAGQTGDEHNDGLSLPTHMDESIKKKIKARTVPSPISNDAKTPKMTSSKPLVEHVELVDVLPPLDVPVDTIAPSPDRANCEVPNYIDSPLSIPDLPAVQAVPRTMISPIVEEVAHETPEPTKALFPNTATVDEAKAETPSNPGSLSESDKMEDDNDDDFDDERVQRLARILARKYFWRSVAAFSFLLGAGCLVLSLNVRDNARNQRRWTMR